MQSPNRIVIAAAGGGKTTTIVDEVAANRNERSVIITYTLTNVQEIQRKFYERHGSIPPHVEIMSWYTFLLREAARPYQNYKYEKRIDGISWMEANPDFYAQKADVGRYYFGNTSSIYSNKLSEFVCDCNHASGGAIIHRLEQRFQQIYIDEIQDMAGYDIDLIELLLKSKSTVTLVGDPRQSTFTTNNSRKHKGYLGLNIIRKFEEWERKKLATIKYQVESHRCNQSIADMADSFYPDQPKTKSLNENVTGHDGVFVIRSSEVSDYVRRFSPQVLRLSVKTNCASLPAMNFGESKGMTFKRVLIFPHKMALKWLATGDYAYVEGVRPELYVGVSRARHSVALVYDHETPVKGVITYVPPNDHEINLVPV